jgi:two-component system sensor kinase FixL
MGERDLPADPDEFYRMLVENSAEGLLTIDAESRIVYANPAIEEILATRRRH